MTVAANAPTEVDRWFAGILGAEYEFLRLICPAAADMSKRVGDFLSDHAQGKSSARLALDLGCGTGITSLAVLRALPGVQVVGIDLEETMLQQARVNLSLWLADGRLSLVERDALSFLSAQAECSVDFVASAYAIHNFRQAYRVDTIRQIYRVLKPGGLFVNGDRYALDDTRAHTALILSEVAHYFAVFKEINRLDLLEQWISHLFSDESPDHVMRTNDAIAIMQEVGFVDVSIDYRDGVNALVAATKPELSHG